jgi:hypothetical protein
LPVICQVRARSSSFGAVGECAKRTYVPSPTAHNAFFPKAQAKKENSDMFFQGYYMMFINNFDKDCFFLSQDLFKVAFSFRAFLIL